MIENEIIKSLQVLADPERAISSLRFFKSNEGEYAADDQFLGITMPVLRQQVKKFRSIELANCISLLYSPIHEIRMFALLVMVDQFKHGDGMLRASIYRAYLEHRNQINNWDLVDCSCYFIVGPYLANSKRNDLYRLAESSNIWEKRIAMVSTLHFIRQNDFADTFKIADILLTDEADLIHKAVGWMLKEVGKRDQKALTDFLGPRYLKMPRTMLRTAIEKYTEIERKIYLNRKNNS